MRKLWIIGTLAAALIAEVASAQGPRARGGVPPATSVYTELNLDRCRRTSAVQEDDSASWRCAGHAGIPLLVFTGDGRFDVDAGVDNGVWESAAAFNNPGPRVEWRVRGGRPFVIIYRLLLTGDDNDGRTVLAVERIGRPGHPGCVMAWIDGASANPNMVARQIADTRAPGFRCGRDEPERIIRF